MYVCMSSMKLINLSLAFLSLPQILVEFDGYHTSLSSVCAVKNSNMKFDVNKLVICVVSAQLLCKIIISFYKQYYFVERNNYIFLSHINLRIVHRTLTHLCVCIFQPHFGLLHYVEHVCIH